ncbi:hypothetical protein JKP88DRAFT_350967 [Tribonema minus]|uniref:Deleted in lung and esophageal cancer protein 1 Ig-like domain-containing protein n=1 Tax=Tribonema minus TaxID=303371 RepID=A0A835YLF8_9STRA|nr:hypothetical protein JKP88DRAFT_350967 [Tribonema minus]
MVEAHQLVQTHVKQKLRESGNLAWDTSGGETRDRGFNLKPETPAYLNTTAVTANRQALALPASYGPRGQLQHRSRRRHPDAAATTVTDGEQPHALATTADPDHAPMDGTNTLRQSPTRHSGSGGSGGGSGDGTLQQQRKARRALPSGAQRDADTAALLRIERKLQFLRNPRHDPRSRWHEKVITVGSGGGGSNSPAAAPGSSGSAAADLTHGTAPGGAANKSGGSSSSSGGGIGGGGGGGGGYILADPPHVEFADYDVGGAYTAVLLLRNVSAVARYLRVLPPQGAHFSLAAVTFPSTLADEADVAAAVAARGCGGGSGLLAPGMAARVLVDFAPDSLGRYDSKLAVLSESGALSVPIRARRAPPALSLPADGVIRCGACLLGLTLRYALTITNAGGGAVTLRLLPEDAYPAPRVAQRLRNALQLGPFRVSPTELALAARGGERRVAVEFAPRRLGEHAARLVLLQDNCEARLITLTATCEPARVAMLAPPSGSADHAAAMLRDLLNGSAQQTTCVCLPQGTAGATSARTLWVHNSTRLPLRMRWCVRPRATPAAACVPVANSARGARAAAAAAAAAAATAAAAAEAAAAEAALYAVSLAEMEVAPLSWAPLQVSFSPQRACAAAAQLVGVLVAVPPAALTETALPPAPLLPCSCGGSARGADGACESCGSSSDCGFECDARLDCVLRSMGERFTAAALADALEPLLAAAASAHGVESASNAGSSSGSSQQLRLEAYDGGDHCEAPAAEAAAVLNTGLCALRRSAAGAASSGDDNAEQQQPLLDAQAAVDLLGRRFCVAAAAGLAAAAAPDALLLSRLQRDVEAVTLEVRAAADPVALSLEPPTLVMAATALYGVPCSGIVTLTNRSTAAPLPFRIDVDRACFVKGEGTCSSGSSSIAAEVPPAPAAAAEADGGAAAASAAPATVVIEPAEGMIPPGGALQLTVTVTPLAVGTLSIAVPLHAPGALPPRCGAPLLLHARVRCAGAAVALAAAETDLGLVAIGARAERALTLTNRSAVAAQFELSTAAVADAAAAAAAAVAAAAIAATGGGGGSAGADSARRPSSASSLGGGGPGGRGRMRSQASIASADSFNIEAAAARLACEPSRGVLAPGASVTVTMSIQAGQAPERIRATLTCALRSADGRGVNFGARHMAVRAEVQEPKVCLSASAIDFGGAYAGIPVERTVALLNLSSLDTRFKLERPGGAAAPTHDITFSPCSGTLNGGDRVAITITYTARATAAAAAAAAPGSPGGGSSSSSGSGGGSGALAVEDILACKVYGIAMPLGLVARARNLPLALSFEALPDGAAPLPPLQPADAPQWRGGGDAPPEAPRALALSFGTVPLLQRRALRFAVRNLSAIPALLELAPRKFDSAPAAPARLVAAPMPYDAFQRVLRNPTALAAYLPPGARDAAAAAGAAAAGNSGSSGSLSRAASGTNSGSMLSTAVGASRCSGGTGDGRSSSGGGGGSGGAGSSGSGGDRLLDAAHEAAEAFSSGQGRARLAAQLGEREAMFALRRGLGMALLVSPAAVRLAPWGVAELSVACWNDTPGRYFDDIVCRVRTDLPNAAIADGCPPLIPMPFFVSAENAPLKVPVKVEVSGCPLSLRAESLGLNTSCTPPVLSFGDVLAFGGGAARALRVRNSGTQTAELHWSLHPAGDTGDEGRIVEVKIETAPPLPPDSAAAGGARGSSRGRGTGSRTASRGGGRSTPQAPLVSLSLAYREQAAFTSAFVVDPPVTRVPPRGEATFKVTIPSHLHQHMAAVLIADATWIAPGSENASEEGSVVSALTTATVASPAASPRLLGMFPGSAPTSPTQSSGGISTPTPATPPSRAQSARKPMSHMMTTFVTARAAKALKGAAQGSGAHHQPRSTPAALKVRLVGRGVKPTLLLDARPAAAVPSADAATAAAAAATATQHIKFTATSTDLAVAAAAPSFERLPAAVRRNVVLTNPLSVPLDCALSLQGPFVLGSVRTGDAALDARRRDRGSVRGGGSGGTAQPPQRHTLLPGRSLTLELAFAPALAAAAALTASGGGGGGGGGAPLLRAAAEGALTVAFGGCGGGAHARQAFALDAVVVRPALTAAPPRHDYGTVHVEAACGATLYLANPTAVDARWSLRHAPAPPPLMAHARRRDGSGAGDRACVDDPSVFSFSESGGTVRGPSLPLGSSAARLPTDGNRAADATWAQCRTKLTWRGGSGGGSGSGGDCRATLSLEQALREANDGDDGRRLPRPLHVEFAPTCATRYRSRFQLVVEGGEGFEVLLEGRGTYEEGTRPNPPPRRRRLTLAAHAPPVVTGT